MNDCNLDDSDIEWAKRVQHCKWMRAREGTIPLTIAEMDFRPHPEIHEYMLKLMSYEETAYGPEVGNLQLSRVVAQFQSTAHGHHVSPEDLIPVSSFFCAMTTLAEYFLRSGDVVVCIGIPFYRPIAEVLWRRGVQTRIIPPDMEGGWSIDYEAVCKILAEKPRIFFIVNPHNPTGKVLSAQSLKTICDVAEQARSLIICDEIYEHLVLSGYHTPVWTVSQYAKMNSIVISGYGKAFNLPGYRLNFLIHKGELLKRLLKDVGRNAFTTSTLQQMALAACAEVGERWLEPLRNQLRSNVEDVLTLVRNTHLLSSSKPDAGFFSWMKWHGSAEPNICAKLSAAGVDVVPGSKFIGSDNQHFRINIATNPVILGEALRRVQHAISP